MDQVNRGPENERWPDPRSWDYPRVYARPQISWAKVLLHIVFFSLLLICALLVATLVFRSKLGMIAAVCFCFAYLLFHLKKLLIFCVQIYQHFAPISVRRMCRFEPSCSQYMILCLQRYGALSGAYRGIRRICRCAHGGGGYDAP